MKEYEMGGAYRTNGKTKAKAVLCLKFGIGGAH
jgi:hypothetical protein